MKCPQNKRRMKIMPRNLLVLALGIALGAGGAAAAYHHEGGESVKLITTHDIKENWTAKTRR